MVLAAVRGGLGFLSRLPVGHDERSWEAFRRSPVAFPLVGYVLGIAVAAPLVVPMPAPSAAFLFVCWIYVLTGINHADGLADLGDGLVVHGEPSTRRRVITDTDVGVGAVLLLVLGLVGLSLAGLALARLPRRALGVVVAAEVGAKLGMAAIACLGTAWHDGLGSALTERSEPRAVILPTIVALPAAALTAPHPAAAAALTAAMAAVGAVFWWARRRVGGVNGDVFGASNEIGRVVALHVGVSVWMLW